MFNAKQQQPAREFLSRTYPRFYRPLAIVSHVPPWLGSAA